MIGHRVRGVAELRAVGTGKITLDIIDRDNGLLTVVIVNDIFAEIPDLWVALEVDLSILTHPDILLDIEDRIDLGVIPLQIGFQ